MKNIDLLFISTSGEASINTIDGCMFWQLMPQNRDKDEPVVNNPEYIYHINPNARILINVRNPVDRYIEMHS